ncbi:sugar-binding domain-containing protein [Mucilaginibacter rivuli]|uniref:sugar-binding domain-containing protein n=1 Tax=Mucilaginibacter rivuli TaxID=2857527 RepID=UPI002103B308|nr:sugar-binding domain-containing protein [Mucilaginibacter rivuli]
MKILYIKSCLVLALALTSFGTLAQTRQTVLFNADWKFHKGDTLGADKPLFNDAAWRKLDLPHDWSIEGPFDEKWASATGYLPAGIGWYRKTFDLKPAMQGKNIYLYFDGVYNNSEVWINGHYLGKRPNGFVSFEYDITKYLNPNGKNTVAVKCDHSQFGDSRWYTGSGIYRNVYLVATPATRIDNWGVVFTHGAIQPNFVRGNVNVSFTNTSNKLAAVTVNTVLRDPEGRLIAKGDVSHIIAAPGEHLNKNLPLSISSPQLWSVDHPALYTLAVSISIEGKVKDIIIQKVGIRSAVFDANKGFALNGKSMKLKGVCIHDDAGNFGVAVPEAVWARRLHNLKEAGVNSIRLSHNPHADYLYDLCDRMGLLVMDEAFDEWELGKNKWIAGWNEGKPGQDGYHEYFKDWADRDLADMIKRDRNHPSIILWSIGNEIDYPNDPYTHQVLNTGRNPQIYGKGYTPDHPSADNLTRIAKHLVAVVKQNDTSRPVTAALAGVVMSNEVGYPEVLDVVGYNYQEFRYPEDHAKYPNRIIYGSENGMNAEAWKAVTDNDYIAGQYLWTGIDYLGEARKWPARSSTPGLLDLAGFKKPEFYYRQSLWSDKPMVYIGTSEIPRREGRENHNAEPTWNWPEGKQVRVSCFTNCNEAELFINGTSLGKKTMTGVTSHILTWDVTYAPGELSVKAYNNGVVVSTYKLVTSGEPYALKIIDDNNDYSPLLWQRTIAVVDKNGNIVYNANNEISVDITGYAKLLGLESGDNLSHEDYKANKRRVFHGKLIAYINADPRVEMMIRFNSPGLKPIEINRLK